MKYQLVIQFPGESKDDFEELIEIEKDLDKQLTTDAEVDGHDFGSGQMNIFILTNEPGVTFNKVKNILSKKKNIFLNMKAAYRDIKDKNFNILWPKDLTKFEVI